MRFGNCTESELRRPIQRKLDYSGKAERNKLMKEVEMLPDEENLLEGYV